MLESTNPTSAPAVNPDRAVPDAPIPASVMVTDTTGSDGGEDVDASMAAQRLAAYHAVHSWRDQPLYPFSFGRRVLFDLCRRFLPMGGLRLPEVYEDTFDADVALLLFLCASSPAEIQAIRHNADLVIDKAFDWAETELPDDQRQAAGELAFLILQQAKVNTAVPQPSGRAQKEGN